MVCPKPLKNYSADQMDAAIKPMKIDGMSMSCTSKIHGVPRIKLHDKISGNWFLLLQYIFLYNFVIDIMFLLIFCFFLSQNLLCVCHFTESWLFGNVLNGQILNIQSTKVSPCKASPLNNEYLLLSFYVDFCFHFHLKF